MPKILIKGDRINLRNFRMSDVKDIVEYCSHRAVARYTSTIPHPYKKKNAVDYLKRNIDGLRKGVDYEFAIILDEKVIGCMSLMHVDKIKAEIGYVLNKKYWKRGYATEAAELIIDYGFKKLKLKRIWGAVAHPNIASQKLLKKLGFKKEGVLRRNIFKNGRYYDRIMFGLLKEEYK